MNLYLAGTLTYYYKTKQFHKATEWRDTLSEWCDDVGVKYFNPATTYLIERNHTYTPRLCVDQNRHYLNKADILIICLDDILQSPGSMWELTYASEVRKIPIIAFGKECWSPHVMNGVSHICEDVYGVIEVLSNMFGQ